MAKYKVNCYYQFVGSVEVEADSLDEAFEKGFEICDKMKSEDLTYVNYLDGEVMDSDGEIYEFK
jgi:hypothetical protein